MRPLLLFGLFAFLLAALPTDAQEGETVISLAVPEIMEDAFTDAVLSEFEAQHPGVRVELRPTMMMGAPTPAYEDIQAHLADTRDYVSSADVLLVENANLSVEATRAGLFMDLSPLASADTTLNAGDFLPQAWESFQWDRGLWALPAAADVYLLLYNPAAFDEANIAYPHAGWTIDDFAAAARALSKVNADGETEPGFFDYATSDYLLRSLLGASLTDSGAVETTPDFSNAQLEHFLTTWQDLREEGVIGGFGGGNVRVIAIGGSADEGPPMTIQRSFGLATFPGNPDAVPPSGSLLPGGFAGLEVQGFAVSAGTTEPQLAYELAKFLTSSPTVANGLFGMTPARRNLAGVQPAEQTEGRGRIFDIASLTYAPEAQAIVDAGFANAIPVKAMVFTEYIGAALRLMEDDGLDAVSALQTMEAQVIANLNQAAVARADTTVIVATPVPLVELGPGEIALDFAIASFVSPLPNQERWQQIVNDFVASDPTVGRINLETDFDQNLDNIAAQYDCFYLPTNAVPGGSLSSLISLDPYLDADPTFNRDDIINGILEQVAFDNRIWAYPLAIQPEVLRYSPALFEQAGIPLPQAGWTANEFVEALRQLKPSVDDPTPFIPRDASGQYLYALINAFGGLPFDQRTEPPTISFTDPATVDAIRQALDLAKDGYIEYSELGQAGGGVNIAVVVGGAEDDAPLYTHTLGAFSFFTRLNEDGNIQQDSYQYVTYPRGSQYTPITFDINTAYISAEADDPDACYRWIRALAQHPDLFSAMPVSRSIIEDPSNPPALTALYQQIEATLAAPNTIITPSALRVGGAANIWQKYWLQRAFDRYVLEDKDLEAELAEAEQFTRDYLACADGIPQTNPNNRDDMFAYFQQFSECATTVDPTASA